jgi:GNAT superfamily N-acetyltransferase
MNDFIIRKYQKQDRQAVRDIAWDTAFIGESAEAFFSDKEVLADLLTQYFTDFEPESCFVAESKGEVLGYIIGSVDTGKLGMISFTKIVPKLLIKIFARNTLLNKKNLACFSNILKSFIKNEFFSKDLNAVYPATFHINIKEKFRHLGIGSNLMAAYLNYLKALNIRGVRLATYSQESGRFFMKNGFTLIYQRPRTYFEYLGKNDLKVSVFGRKI